ncbi:MAG: hypothetical protein ACR2MP_34155 [Streptosporangiaceae bacterium]
MRMRLVGWQVVPVVMADDGENLEAVQVQPQMIPAGQWAAFKAGGDEQALTGLRQQLEGSGAEPQTSVPTDIQEGGKTA